MSDKPINQEEITQAEFARRKKVSRASVHEAVMNKRVTLTDNKKLLWPDASVEWDINTDPSKQRTVDGQGLQAVTKHAERYHRARADKEESLAGKAKLELQELEGQMLRADVIKPLYANVLTMLKNNCLAVSRRVSTSLVGLTSAEEIGDKIYQEIEIALHSVSQDAFKGHTKLKKG